MLIIILVLAAVLTLLPGFILFVSIVWTHRPDLSVMDILRECMREIKNSRSKGEKQHEQDHHL